MDGSLLVAAGTAALCTWGWLESHWHLRNLRRVPIRIHVNGTRGKSTVTRLIAAGLRAGGLRTVAKTTGTLPRAIFPDGTEYPVFRPARANIIEQLRIARLAATQQADALVIECMALQPLLQSLCELKLVRATHGVVTNVRADHLDVMGPTVDDVASALAATVPVGGSLFTTEQHHLRALRDAATDRGSRVIPVGDDAIAEIRWEEMERFPYIEHPENVALALRVCQDVGVPRDVALRGMWQASPDPGVMKLYQIQKAGRPILFINAFAANDPESTGRIWDMIVSRYAHLDRHIAVVNCRADRPDRSAQLAEAAMHWRPADHYVVTGTDTDAFTRRAEALGMDRGRVTTVHNPTAAGLVETVARHAGDSALVMGMGNIAGPGFDLVQYFDTQQDRRCSFAAAPTSACKEAA
jgi:poly-gamma-glutamate synthase PgsB/CapB